MALVRQGDEALAEVIGQTQGLIQELHFLQAMLPRTDRHTVITRYVT